MSILPAAIGIVLNEQRTEVLLIKRKDVPVWVLPGGGIEAGEAAEDALMREIKEETGFEVEIVRKTAEYSPLNRLASETHVYICRILAGKPCASSETQAIAFHPLAQLPSMFFPPHAIWLSEALAQQQLIRRPLKEISYWPLIKYFLHHPWQVLRFAWTRLTKK